MKKKSIAALLTVLMLAVTGCGMGDGSSVNGTTVNHSSEAEADSKTSASEEKKEEETDEDADFSIGTNSGSYYENTFFGIRYTPSNGMEFLGEDYLEQLNQLVGDLLNEADVKKSLDGGNTVTIAASANEDNTLTFNIGIQNMKSVFSGLVSEDFIIESSLEATQQTLEAMNLFDTVEVKKGTATFLGEEHVSMDVVATIQGINFYEQSVVLRKGSYAAIFTAAAYEEGGTQVILDDVTSIE